MKNLNESRLDNAVIVSDAVYTIGDFDEVILSTRTTTGTQSIIFPSSLVLLGRKVVIKDFIGNATTNNITISTEGSETIDGLDTYVIVGNYDSVTIISDGSNWGVI